MSLVSILLNIARPVNVSDSPILVSVLLSIQLQVVLRKHLVIGQYSFSLFFVDHHRQQTLYDYGIIRGFIGHLH